MLNFSFLFWGGGGAQQGGINGECKKVKLIQVIRRDIYPSGS